IKQKEVDERVELDDAAVVAVIDKMVKQRKDSITAFEQGNRPDLAAQEAAELSVLQAYLPERLSAEAVAAEVKAIVAELGAKGPGDMGKVMGAVKTRLAGKADMGQVAAAVKAALAGREPEGLSPGCLSSRPPSCDRPAPSRPSWHRSCRRPPPRPRCP